MYSVSRGNYSETRCEASQSGDPLYNVVFPSGLTADLGDNSNICMACHQGRESKSSIDSATPNSVVQSPSDYDSYDFINIHYYPAATSFFGTDVKGGYEYSGKTYVGQNFTSGTHNTNGLNKCVACHMRGSFDHEFEPKVVDCNSSCHTGIVNFEDIRPSGTPDYDGDTDITEGLRGEIETLESALFTEIQTYASNTLGYPVVYEPSTYPYYFNDTNGNGTVDAGENIYPNRYRHFDEKLLKAAYNYQVSKKEPCGYIHNHRYIIQLLIDSIEDLGGTVSGYTRP